MLSRTKKCSVFQCEEVAARGTQNTVAKNEALPAWDVLLGGTITRNE